MSISEALSRSSSEGVPVHCPKSTAKHHPKDCACKGTAWVTACAECSGSGFSPAMQQVCATCGGNGCLTAPKQKAKKHDDHGDFTGLNERTGDS